MNEILYSTSSISLLQVLLCAGLLASATMVNLSSNPVESVLFLVLTFVTSGILLMMLLSEFFGITVIIIYVGAIAVLFLFVIMMLNIKGYKTDKKDTSVFQTKIAKFSLCSSVLYLISVIIGNRIADIFDQTTSRENLFLIDPLNNIEVLGQVLYNYYIECFLIAGLVLLVALIGSIVLTLTYSNTKKGHQLPNRQLSRSDKFLSFFE